MGKFADIKDRILYKTEDVSESYEITPWKVTKGVACLIGAGVSSFVVGSVLRENMPSQTKTFGMVKTAIGIYLLEGLASNAVGNYIDETLSQYDDIFEPHDEPTTSDDGWRVYTEGAGVIIDGREAK